MLNSHHSIVVRPFAASDAASLLVLMKALAKLEDYLSDFRVTESDLLERGFGANPEFQIIVAEPNDSPGELLGMAVYYLIPYTYDLAPDLVLKELFVGSNARGAGVGRALIKQLQSIASNLGCRRMKWLVLNNNEQAKGFYRSVGAIRDLKWENWSLAVGKSQQPEYVPVDEA